MFAGMLVQPGSPANAGLCIGEPDAAAAAQAFAVRVGLDADRADAEGGELLVAVLGVAGHPHRADHLALRIAHLPPASLLGRAAARADLGSVRRTLPLSHSLRWRSEGPR